MNLSILLVVLFSVMTSAIPLIIRRMYENPTEDVDRMRFSQFGNIGSKMNEKSLFTRFGPVFRSTRTSRAFPNFRDYKYPQVKFSSTPGLHVFDGRLYGLNDRINFK